MINGVHHVSLSASNLDGILAFYRDLLGLDVAAASTVEPATPQFQAVVGIADAAYRHVWLRAGNVLIEIFQYTNPVGKPVTVKPACDAGIRHICFDVADIQFEYRRLKAAGVEFLCAPQFLAGGKIWSVYARDPEGNLVELQEILLESPVTDRLSTFAPLK